MSVTTFPGIVENGQIRLADNVRLPDNATVYVVVPGLDVPPVVYVGSPRLANPNQADDFVKAVSPEIPNAVV